MLRASIVPLFAALAAFPQTAALAPTGTLRVAFLAGNPAQSVEDANGQRRGVAIDLSRELARRLNVPVTFSGLANPAAVIEAVASGKADIGYVAYAPSRRGTVEFSQTYLLNQQTLLVPNGSPLRNAADIDRSGLRIGGAKGDSISLYLARVLKQARLIEIEGSLEDTRRQFTAKSIDAFGANRQRLATWAAQLPGYRVVDGGVMDVPQTIVVPLGKPAALAAVNSFIDDVRRSGLLARSISASGVTGITVAPEGYGYGKAE